MNPPPSTPSPSPRAPDPAFWLACALGAPPVAWLATRLGLGINVVDPVRDLAWIALASVAEEIVFRGGLQQALLQRPAGRVAAGPVTVANAATSALFALVHLWQHPALAALAVLPVSLLLGWAYERSAQRLAPPIALHVYFNLVLYGASVYSLVPAPAT
jgi:membrane protease YdiL (CAAX protease family)